MQRIFLMAIGVLFPAMAMAEVRFSIAIGNDLGLSGDEPLRWAQRDAIRFDEISHALGEVQSDRHRIVLGERPERVKELFLVVKHMIQRQHAQGQKVMLTLFYSGHGDDKALRMRGERWPIQDFSAAITDLGADTTVAVIDACHSGALIRGRSKGLSTGPSFHVALLRDRMPKGEVWITSSGADEVAQESDLLQSSYFAHNWLTGLRGAADADGDGQITLGEAYQHVYHTTTILSQQKSGAAQHPGVKQSTFGEGEIVLAQLHQGVSTLTLDGLVGQILVVDDVTERVMAEMRVTTPRSMKIALAPGRYRINVRNEGTSRAGKIILPVGGQIHVSRNQLKSQPLWASLAKGAGADPSPWTAGIGGGVGMSALDANAIVYYGSTHLSYALRGRLRVGGRLNLQYGKNENQTFSMTDWQIDAAGGVGYAWSWGRFGLEPWADLGVGYMWRKAVRHDADTLSFLQGISRDRNSGALQGSVGAHVVISMALTSRWTLLFVPEVRGVFFKEDDAVVIRPQVRAVLGAGASF